MSNSTLGKNKKVSNLKPVIFCPAANDVLNSKKSNYSDKENKNNISKLKTEKNKLQSPAEQQKPRPRTSNAASYLGKTADGLAKMPKRYQNVDRPAYSNHANGVTETATSKSPAKTPNKPSHHLQFDVKVVDFSKSPASFHQIKNQAASSPTLSKIPSHIVRQRVEFMQTSHSSKPFKSDEEVRQIGSIRKSLAGVFEIHKSTNSSRKSCLLGSNEDAAEDLSVTVAVRVRPFSQRESDLKATQVVFVNGNETVVTDGVSEHSFLYDHSFWSADKNQGEYASQRTVYEALAKPLLCAAFDGYNTCLFAYGQTGSGKSYTIMGLGDDKGIVPRFCDEMFACIHAKERKNSNIRNHVQVSYFEIYNEKIHDLLVSSGGQDGNNAKQVLKVREHPETGPYVEGLSKFIVSSFEDVQAWIEVGNRQRATASTGMNDKSSRSHSVFTMNLVQTTIEDLEGEKHESNCRSLINLVDLAGSERSSSAGTSGQRLKEGASINKSLLTLGKVISTLSERSAMAQKRRKRCFVPYRDSTLTWILRESLGGNSRTAMIATVSPASCHMDETLSTLRYAKQARSIVNLVKINEEPNARIIRELKAEIAKLKEAYGQTDIDAAEFKASLLEVNNLRQQLCAAEKEKAKVQEEWKKKLEQSEKRKAEEINELKRAGVSFKVDNRLPNLVNLNEDPQLSELLLYVIKRGITRVGRKGGECDIHLSGALVAPLHCKISNVDDVVTIEPITDASTFVNGEIISKREILHHGDRVIIGGDHFFRLNHPIEIQQGEKKRNSGGKRKDFEFAKLELIERQNERLQREIHEAQLKVKQEMLGEIEAAKLEAQHQISSQRTEYEKEIKTLQAQLVKDQSEIESLQTVFEQSEKLHRGFKFSRKNRHEDDGVRQLELSTDDVKNQVFASLEAERQKLAEEVEKMQQKKLNRKEESDNSNAVPLRLSLLLQEANTISQSLNKHTRFLRHDTFDDQSAVMIKVHNVQLGIWTLWPLDKFEEKLETMREMYNGQNDDGNGDYANVFYDPDDDWQEAYAQSNGTNSSLTTQKNTHRLSRRLSSLVLARASPALQESLTKLNQRRSPLPLVSQADGPTCINFCKRLLGNAMKEFTEDSSSLIDNLLLKLEEISSMTNKIVFTFNENEDYSSTRDFQDHSLTLSVSVQTFLTFISCVKSVVSDVTSASPSVAKLFAQVVKAAKELVSHVSKLLQGCCNCLDQIISESCSGITRALPNISKYCGAITIAADLPLNIFDEDRQHKLSHRLKHAFLQGGDTFIRRVLSGGISRLSEMEKENLVKSPHVENLSTATIRLLRMCMDLQQELYDGSLIIHERSLPVQYYAEYLQRTQGLIREVGTLIDGVAQLNNKASEYANEASPPNDLRYKAESLWRPTSRIADLCVKHEGLCAIMHDLNSSQSSSANANNNNNSKDGNTSCYRHCDSICEASRSLHNVLRDFIQMVDPCENDISDVQSHLSESTMKVKLSSKDNITPEKHPFRKKRILPSNPSLLDSSSSCQTSGILKSTVEKWLQFADCSYR